METTTITISDYGIGTHSATHVSNNGNPVLYDPAGSYRPPNGNDPRGSGDTFYGESANLNDYVKYHLENGSKVELIYFDTTPNQERKILDNIDDIGGGMPFFCTTNVSQSINGVGPFKNLGGHFSPGSLSRSLKKIRR